VKPGRNEPCPCGSGLKVKRCCGVDAAGERERRRNEAAAELFDLALHFPRYRPRSPEFDRWALAAPEEATPEALEEGVNALDLAEQERVARGFAADQPEIWSSVVADFLGEEALAADLVLAGAVVAGVAERRRPLDEPLALLERDAEAREDPLEALALALVGDDLWSVIESAEVGDAIDGARWGREMQALAAAADRLATPWHEERLLLLAMRLRGRLPDADYPLASAALEAACGLLMRDGELQRRLRIELLLDSLSRLHAFPVAA